MRKAADLLHGRANRIAVFITGEQGRSPAQSKAETLGAGDTIEGFAEEARRTTDQVPGYPA